MDFIAHRRRMFRPPLENRGKGPAFTLVELLVSVALLAFLLLILSTVTDSARGAWSEGKKRTETFQSARTALELMARELTPAVVDTRMQFVVAPGEILKRVGARHVAADAPALLWMAPLGEDGELRCVGYYLARDEVRRFHRLKRIYIGPKDPAGKPARYFPKMINLDDPRDSSLRISPVDAKWFTRRWNSDAFNEEDPTNDELITADAADGVIAFWVQSLDVLGNPVPVLSKAENHPLSELYYNSAAYFQVATSTPFEGGASLVYLAETPQAMKANRVPAAVDLTVVTLDTEWLALGKPIPAQTSILTEKGTLDVEASVREFTERLHAHQIHKARVFTTRAKLINGS
jgi:type II secretory pathway component PulJ